MKTKMKYLVVYISFTIASLIYANEASAQRVSVSFQVFYDQLSPYGHWVNNPQYGYVWLPNVGPGFTPYETNGYWVMTDYGMTWVSDYSWGWAPFHYGRWEYDNYIGWFWVPDTEWGPAWVVWRQSSGYYGWAPMRPGISVTVSFGNHYHPTYDHWVFVRYNDIDRHDLHRCYVNRRYHNQIIRNSTVINNIYVDNSHHTTYVAGPNRNDLRRNTGRNIRTVSVYENDRPGQNIRNDRMNIYRPRVTRTGDRQERVAPNKIANVNDIRRNNTRNSNYQTQNIDQSNKRRTNETYVNNSNNRRQEQNTYQTNNQTRNQQQYSNQSNRNQQKQQRVYTNTQKNTRNSSTNSTRNSSRNTNQNTKQSNGRRR